MSKRSFQVGDRVAVYGSSTQQTYISWGRTVGVVTGDVDEGCIGVKLDGEQHSNSFHPKQLRRLRPPKPRRRVDIDAFLSSILHGNDGHRQWLTEEFTKAFGPAPRGQFVEAKRRPKRGGDGEK